MKLTVEQFCEKINNEAQQIGSFISKKNKFCSEVFDAPIEVDSENRCEKILRGRKGIYIFIVQYAVSLDTVQVQCWNNKVSGGKFKEYKGIEINDGDCLYLGSCVSKSLYSRINQHFSDSGNYQSLKLGHPARKILIDDVCCKAFPIQKGYSEQQYRIILPSIEKRLHEILVPLCGSSRT